MLTPYEVAVRTVIPAIRSMIVKELYMKYNMKQKDIARLLDLTQAVVSYYLSDNRGKVIDLSDFEDVIYLVREKARIIFEKKPDPKTITSMVLEITKYFISRGYLCRFHRELEPDVNPECCGLCKELFRL